MTSLERTPWSLLHPEEDKAVKLTPHEVDLIAHALTKLADEYDRHPTHTPEEIACPEGHRCMMVGASDGLRVAMCWKRSDLPSKTPN